MPEVVDSQQDVRVQAARAAADAVRRDGAELCARLVFRTSRNELRHAGITTSVALYDELKQVFWNADEGVTLGDHLSVGFGKVDRRRQVRAFAERHAEEPVNVVAKAYEREYGFSAGIAAIWLGLFAEPTNVSFSEWLGIEAAEHSADVPVASAGAPEVRDSDREGSRIEDFLSRELTGDICDVGLVRRRFAFEFPDERPETFERGVNDAGYYEDRGVLFREGNTPNGHFTRLLASHPSFAKGDAGFEDAVWKHPTFRRVLGKALDERRLLLYEPGSYLSFSRIHDVLGVCMTDIESYAALARVSIPELEPFTVTSLRSKNGFAHALDRLEMPDAFYEGLLDSSGLFHSCVLAGSRVFVAGGEGRFSAANLIEWLVAHHEGIERADLPRLLVDELGVSCPTALLTTTVYNADVYYDDIGDRYYSSMDVWKKEACDELA